MFTRTAAGAWRWMRIDVPVRIVPLVGVPIVWAVVWGGGLGAIGLRIPFAPSGWLWIGLISLAVISACVVFVAGALNWSAKATRGALALEIPFFLLLNPFAEELLFRGLFQPRLEALIGFPAALTVVSLIFGFHHAFAGFNLRFLLWASLGGFLFGAVAAQYSSVVPAMLLHSAADLGIFLFGPWVSARRQARISLTPRASGR